MPCAPTPPMYVYYSSTFEDNTQQVDFSFCKTATTVSTILSFVCLIRSTENLLSNFSLPARLQALTDKGHLSANDEALVPLQRKVRANILKRSLLRIISISASDLRSDVSPFARAGKFD